MYVGIINFEVPFINLLVADLSSHIYNSIHIHRTGNKIRGVIGFVQPPYCYCACWAGFMTLLSTITCRDVESELALEGIASSSQTLRTCGDYMLRLL